ncbi:MAG: sulfur carrier protein ThiS adenylyltransferase ThiF [Candidatus Cloacimonetes bacterium]|nr:sulfur carrier protein ThiS adenylyltransferase ThiF [Candidatus Cloacimonadota bacterium]
MLLEDFFIDSDELVLAALSQAKVAIAGAGGLGSNCAVALARSGTGKLIICDFDRVSAANLNRQYYFREQIGLYKVEALKHTLKRINPFSDYDIHNVKLDKDNLVELFEDVDIIIEAFDEASMKQMLIEMWSEFMGEIPLIVASGIGGFGKNEEIRQRQSGNLFLIGDEISDVHKGYKPLAPRVGVVANMQANLAVELLVKKFYGKGRKV